MFLMMLLFCTNCKRTEYIWTSTFRFVNSTSSNIHIQGWNNKRLSRDLIVPKNSQVELKETNEGTPMNPGHFFSSDSIELTFDNNKKLIYSWYRKSPTSKYIGNGIGYEQKEISERHLLFTYLLNQEHIDSAQ